MKIQERLQALKTVEAYLESSQTPVSRKLLGREFLELSIADDFFKQNDPFSAFDIVLKLVITSIPEVSERLLYRLAYLALKIKDFKLASQIHLFMFRHDDHFEAKQMEVLLNSLIRCHEYEKAIDICHTWCDKDPALQMSEEMQICYSKALNGLGESEQALELLEQIESPQNIQSYQISKALCLKSLARFEEALEIYKALEKDAPTHIRLYCARQYALMGMGEKLDHIMQGLITKEPENVAYMTNYLRCLFRKSKNRTKAMKLCNDYLRAHADKLNFEELKELYLIKAWNSSKDVGLGLYEQLRLSHPNDLTVLKEYIHFAMRHQLDALVNELKLQLNDSHQMEINDFLQRPLLKEAWGLMSEGSASPEISLANKTIQLPQEIQNIMREIQASTSDEIYLVGSTIIDLMQTQYAIELKDIDLVCLSNRQQFKGFIPNPHIQNYHTKHSIHPTDYECGLIVMNSDHTGSDFLRANVLNRDFTICALFATTDGKVFDPSGKGFLDIQHRILRTVIDAKECLSSNPVRYLRAIKYLSRGFFPEQELNTALYEFSIQPHLKNAHFMANIKSLMISANFENHLRVLTSFNQLPLIMQELDIPFGLESTKLRELIITKINQRVWSLQQTPSNMSLSEEKTIEYLNKQLAEQSFQHENQLQQFDMLFKHQQKLSEMLGSRESDLRTITQEISSQQKQSQAYHEAKEATKELNKLNLKLKKQIAKQEDAIQASISQQLENIYQLFRQKKHQKTSQIRQLDGRLLQIHHALMEHLQKNNEASQELSRLEHQKELLMTQSSKKNQLLAKFKTDLSNAPIQENKKAPLQQASFNKPFYSSGQLGFETLYRFVMIPSLRKAMHLEIVKEELKQANNNIYKIYIHLMSFYDFDETKIPKAIQLLLDQRNQECDAKPQKAQEFLYQARRFYNCLSTHQAHYYFLKALEASHREHAEQLNCIYALAEFYMNQKDIILFDQLYQKYLKQFSNHKGFHHQFGLFFNQIRQDYLLYQSLIHVEFPTRHLEHYWWFYAVHHSSFFHEICMVENEQKAIRSFLTSIYDQSAQVEEIGLVLCHLQEKEPLVSLMQKKSFASELQFFNQWFDEHTHSNYLPELLANTLSQKPVDTPEERKKWIENDFDETLFSFSPQELKDLYDRTAEPLIAAKIAFVLALHSSQESDTQAMFNYLYKVQMQPELFLKSFKVKLPFHSIIQECDWATVDRQQLIQCAENSVGLKDLANAETFYLMLLDIEPYSYLALERLLILYFSQDNWGEASKIFSRLNQLLNYFQPEDFCKVDLFNVQIELLHRRIKDYQQIFDNKKNQLKQKIAEIEQEIAKLGQVVFLDSQYAVLRSQRVELHWDLLKFHGFSYSEEYLESIKHLSKYDSQMGIKYCFAHFHQGVSLLKEDKTRAARHVQESLVRLNGIALFYPDLNIQLENSFELLNSSFYFQIADFINKTATKEPVTFMSIFQVLAIFTQMGRPDLLFSNLMNHFRKQDIDTLKPLLKFHLALLLGQKTKAMEICDRHRSEIMDFKELGWLINEKNLETFFNNRDRFFQESLKLSPSTHQHVLVVNVYNEIMHNAFLQGDLRKAELNFKLALLKCKLSGVHYTMQFLMDYLEYVQNHGYQELYQNAIDFILEKKDVIYPEIVEYINSLTPNTSNIKQGGSSRP